MSNPLDTLAPVPRTRRPWLPYVGVGLLLALITAGLWPRALPVETAAVTRGPLAIGVEDEGRTRVTQRYTIAAPVSGTLQRIPFKSGAPVVAGQTLLATLATGAPDLLDARALAQAEARLAAARATESQAEARLASLQATLAQAKADRDRSAALTTQGVLSNQENELATTRALTAAQDERAATFALAVARHEVAQARATLARGLDPAAAPQSLALTAPVSGVVLRVYEESSRPVAAGTPLLEIGDPTDLEIVVEVLSRDAVAIRPGAPVILERWGGTAPLTARVRLVEPAAFTKISALGVEEQRVNVIADLLAPVAERPSLGDAYRVEARVITTELTNTLRAPAGALFQLDGRWHAYVADDTRARLREVKPGPSDGLLTAITSGLSEGERVVIYPPDTLADGKRIRSLIP